MLHTLRGALMMIKVIHFMIHVGYRLIVQFWHVINEVQTHTLLLPRRSTDRALQWPQPVWTPPGGRVQNTPMNDAVRWIEPVCEGWVCVEDRTARRSNDILFEQGQFCQGNRTWRFGKKPLNALNLIHSSPFLVVLCLITQLSLCV